MSRWQGMYDHFARIAGVYREIRTTDEAPILFIRDALADRDEVRAADIGCGAGRYDLLLFHHLPNLHLICVDVNRGMLAELSRYLTEGGFLNFETIVGSIEDLELEDESLDSVFTFNAVHHFDFQTFLKKAGRALRKKGQIFVHTRTPRQNAGSIWGRYFPDFCEKEKRLYHLTEMEKWVEQTEDLQLVTVKKFRYPRFSSLDRLLTQARSRHYSTFSFYKPEELETSCRIFEHRVRRHFHDIGEIRWHDENVVLQIRA
jgi:SAM-dependent methyltransferase